MVFGRQAAPPPAGCLAAAGLLFLLALLRARLSPVLVLIAFVLFGASRSEPTLRLDPLPEGPMVWDLELLGPPSPSEPQLIRLRAAWSSGPHRGAPIPRWLGSTRASGYGLSVARLGLKRGSRFLAQGRPAAWSGRSGEPVLLLDLASVSLRPAFRGKAGAVRAYLDSSLGGLRKDFRRTIDRYAPGDLNALFKALALGDRRGLAASQRESFARTGTSHLLAISGLHIGLLAGLVFAASRWLFRRALWLLSPQWAEAGHGDVLPGIVAGIAAASYVALAGAPISGRRALAMLGLYLLIRRLRRDSSSWNVLGGAAGIVLLCDPTALTELGLHLSLVSVAGLLLIPRRKVGVPSWSSRVIGLLRSSLLASVATAFATAPLCALIWGRLAISGLWVNVAAIALLGAGTVPPLLLGCLAGAVHDGLARPFLMLASVCASWGLRLITAAAQPEWSPMLYWQPDVSAVLALYFGLAAVLFGGVLARRRWATKGEEAEDGGEAHHFDRSTGSADSCP